MTWSIPVIIITACIIALYLADRPEILEGMGDAALVRCEINEHLSEALAGVSVSQDQRRVLSAMAQGKNILVGDVRDVGDRVKNMVKPAVWDSICNLAGR